MHRRNTNTEIEISSELEVRENNGGKDIEFTIKNEITRIGIAMQLKSFMYRSFLCLNGSFYEYLQRNNLLVDN